MLALRRLRTSASATSFNLLSSVHFCIMWDVDTAHVFLSEAMSSRSLEFSAIKALLALSTAADTRLVCRSCSCRSAICRSPFSTAMETATVLWHCPAAARLLAVAVPVPIRRDELRCCSPGPAATASMP